MIVVPAIDLMEGKVVRLTRGEKGARTVYHNDPVAWAAQLRDQGAQRLHVVDLDGAFQGLPVHAALIARIIAAAGIPVQVGGGLRTLEAVEQVLACGAALAILGTRALADDAFRAQAIGRFGARIAVGLDARAGKVALEGWTRTDDRDAAAVASRLGRESVSRLVFTEASRDGVLGGPDIEGTRAVARAFGGPVTASGGVGSLEHLRALSALGADGVDQCIVGKALYERAFTLAQGIEAARCGRSEERA